MEEDKKKKKNKKKKNKQNKTMEDAAVGAGETASLDQNHIVEQNHRRQVSETADVSNAVLEKPNGDLDRHCSNGTEGSVLAEADKKYWMQREASLEETIKQLKNENELYIQKQAALEMRIVQLQNEVDSWLQKEAGLEENISRLLDEKAVLSLKGANLEEKIIHLEREKDSWVLKEANLEEKIVHLEREKDSWVLKENSTKETIASLNDDNTRLRIQVMELEESRSKILQENQLLMENVSGMQSQIQNLESTSSARSSTETTKHASENEDFYSQMEAARSLVEKLVTENTELVEKVNELYIELDRRRSPAGPASAIGYDPTNEPIGNAAVSDPMFETIGSEPRNEPIETAAVSDSMLETFGSEPRNEPIETAAVFYPVLESSEMSVSSKKTEPQEAIPIKDENTGSENMDTESAAIIVNSSETSGAGEIVQIPLDENEVRDVELSAAESDEKAAVPLTDAPLIGAPFRLISFVAKYVSGADLVNKSSS